MELVHQILYLTLGGIWTVLGTFLLYTTIRDDIRNEKKRKEENK